MAHLKKLVLQGFKSFARRTEIPLENSMNVIVGPNGSGKSNITDALCFVLGRMSIKSIRAAKAANLLFSGNKQYKGSNEAIVELVFDNQDRAFTIDTNEIAIKRIVRRNGLSIYKINEEVRTRQELIELLAQAGIDPNGFNIVLQGEIAHLIKLSSEERRKILEEVAGISIYESRKVKSLQELEKSDEKLKEVSAVLREKNAYLRNLEKERQDALNYQKLDQTIKKCKATIFSKTIKEKEKEVWAMDKLVENQKKEIELLKTKIKEKEIDIRALEETVSSVNKEIQSSTGEEQEVLHKELSELKAEIASLNARKENFENRLVQNKSKEENIKNKLKDLQTEIAKIKSSNPNVKQQQEKYEQARERMEIIEKQRRQFYLLRSDISSLENRKEEKSRTIIGYQKELEILEKNINTFFAEIKHEKSIERLMDIKQKTLDTIKRYQVKKKELENEILEIEKKKAILEQIAIREKKLKEDIVKLDVCPMCRSNITEEHKCYVIDSSNKKITNSDEEVKGMIERKGKLQDEIYNIIEDSYLLEQKAREIEIDMIKVKSAEEKKNQIRRVVELKNEVEVSLKEMDSKLTGLKSKIQELVGIEEKYDDERLKMQEISMPDIDSDTQTALKQREFERLKTETSSITRDNEETAQELKKINEKLSEKEKIADKKEKEEEELYEKFQKLFTERNEMQDRQKAIETTVIGFTHQIRNIEDKINGLNTQRAHHLAQLETLRIDFKEFENIETLNIPIEQAREKITELQIKLSDIGSINLKALEIYDKVKESCEAIEARMKTIETEKEKIMKIIQEIDKKKKKTFIQTLDALNALFTRNFSQLSKKGEVFLDLENKEDPFVGGLNIIVKVARGKYFDITSLSGGEKTLIALSLIFAIQEYKPFCFYVFDEIDAALDKHNSELLAALIKKYMTMGQYIVVTHNDALISEATNLFGVSMQEGISKVISLKV